MIAVRKTILLKIVKFFIAVLYFLLIARFIYWIGHFFFDYDLSWFNVPDIPYGTMVVNIILIVTVVTLEEIEEHMERK